MIVTVRGTTKASLSKRQPSPIELSAKESKSKSKSEVPPAMGSNQH